MSRITLEARTWGGAKAPTFWAITLDGKSIGSAKFGGSHGRVVKVLGNLIRYKNKADLLEQLNRLLESGRLSHENDLMAMLAEAHEEQWRLAERMASVVDTIHKINRDLEQVRKEKQ